MPQSRHPRAWVQDTRICANCGHTRARHGGNVGKGAFGSKVFCVEWVTIDHGSTIEVNACKCRTFTPRTQEE